MCSIGKKNLLNSMRKRGGKTGDLINKKPHKLDKETKRKTNHLLVKVEIVCKG